MAMQALAAHKLRSALTLVGVLVGVFSIIAVMTAMRVMQNNIETELSQLGTHSFVVQKFPEIFVGEDWQKIWRRKNITYQLAQTLRDKASLAQSVGVEARLWRGEVRSRFAQTTPSVILTGVSPESFAAMHIPGAVNLPVVELARRAADTLPDRHARIVTYCGGPT